MGSLKSSAVGNTDICTSACFLTAVGNTDICTSACFLTAACHTRFQKQNQMYMICLLRLNFHTMSRVTDTVLLNKWILFLQMDTNKGLRRKHKQNSNSRSGSPFSTERLIVVTFGRSWGSHDSKETETSSLLTHKTIIKRSIYIYTYI